MSAPAQVFKFHDFEFSTRRQELRKGQIRVRMSASQIRLLALFLERPGELVTRNDIASRVWDDTSTIDVANGVNTAINRLRFSLGDNSGSPRYLETVIGLGYRFIAPVTQMPEEVGVTPEAVDALATETFPQQTVPALHTIPVPSAERNRGLKPRMLWSAFAILLIVGTAALIHFGRRSAVHEASSAQKVIGALRVTANSGGKQITAAALSSDGNLLAYADSSGIRVQNLATHHEYPLGTLPASEVNELSWFPGGDQLAVSGRDVNTNLSTVWLVASSGVTTSVLAAGADLGTVSPDGNKLAFTRSNGAEIWVSDHDGLSVKKLLKGNGKDVFSLVLWSPDSKRLMLVSHGPSFDRPGTATGNTVKPVISTSQDGANVQQPDHWAWDSVDSTTGKLLAHEENTPMVSAVISPTGYVRFVTGTLRGNVLSKGKVFSVQTDPATGRFLEAPVNENTLASHNVSAITSSQDGSKIGFIANTMTADVFTASLHEDAGGVPELSELHRLTSNLADTYPHAWTPDGTVIYETQHQSHLAIFGSQHGVPPVLLAQLPVDAALAQLTPDSRWILFLGIQPGGTNVYRVPARGGIPERVPGVAGLEDEISCARKGPVACVLRRKEMEHGVAERHYFAFDPMTGTGTLLARTPWVPARRGDWSLSPDGSTVVVANRDAVHPALNLLKLSGASSYERILPLSGHSAPLGAVWSADGKALFVETRTANSFTLLYMRINGQPRILRESPSLIWAVPSPDGKQIAFPESTVNTNVWVTRN